MPVDSSSLEGFGGSLTWAADDSLCTTLLSRFKAETFEYFGAPLFSFVSCEEITDALLRGFAMWSANHARLAFFTVSSECALQNATSAASCSLAEIVIAGGTNPAGVPLVVDVESADKIISRVSLTFDTSCNEA